MTEAKADAEVQPRAWLALTALCALVPACLYRIPSADLWWLLAQGRWIWQQHWLPTQEIFSFTAAGQTWHNDQWLSALVFYGLESLGGLLALHILKGIFLCATFALLLDTGRILCSRRADFSAGATLLLPFLGLLCLWQSQMQFFFDVRAYIFSYFLLALWWRWLCLSDSSAQPSRRLLLAFVLTAWLWANLHAGIVMGLGLVVLAGLGGHRWVRSQARFLPLAALVTLINPSGWDLHLHVVRLLGSDWGKALNEWQPIWRDWHLFAGFPLLLAATLVLAVILRPARWEVLCLAFVGLMSLSGWRHVLLFSWLALPLWCRAAGPLAARLGRRLPVKPLQIATLAFFLARAAYWVPQYSASQLSLVNAYFPRWGADFLQANQLGPRLFHHYGWGGYLIWRLAPAYEVCIDGRAAQVYPVEAYLDYIRASGKRENLEKYLERYHIDTVMLSARPHEEASRTLLDGNPDFQVIYEDDFCCIFQRRTALKATYTYPPNPRNLLDKARSEPASAAALVEQVLQLDPEYPQAYFLRGVLSLQKGDPRGASDLEKALSLDPSLPNAHFNLAIFYGRSDPQRAYRELAEEVRVNPQNDKARRLLEERR